MDTETPTIVFLHGITRNKIDMAPLFLYFQSKGYRGINIEYPSTKMPIEELSTFVGRAIRDDMNYNPFAPMHFITHSMGGLITRYFLADQRPPQLGKVVMLGTPNSGSECADFLHEHEIFGDMFKALFGPAGAQLRTNYEHKMANSPIDYPLGVIAGTSNINPLTPWLFNDEANDGIVPVERTKIEGMSDHIVLPVSHPLMMVTPKVMRQARHFIEHGHFDHSEEIIAKDTPE